MDITDLETSSSYHAKENMWPEAATIDLFNVIQITFWERSGKSGNHIVCDPMCQIRKKSSLFGNVQEKEKGKKIDQFIYIKFCISARG